jgi:hypothetical protein
MSHLGSLSPSGKKKGAPARFTLSTNTSVNLGAERA